MIKILFSVILISIFVIMPIFASIELKNECFSTGKTIKLSDLVENRGDITHLPEISFGNSPLPGRIKYIAKNYIKFKLDLSNFNANVSNNFVIPDKIKIVAPFKNLDIEEIEKNIENHISSTIKDDYDRFNINILKISNKECKLPVSEFNYQVRLNRKGHIKGKIVGFVDILIDDKIFKSINFIAEVKAWKKLFVANKKLNFNEIITKDKISSKLVNVTKLNIKNAIENEDVLLMKAAKQRILKDRIIKLSDLKAPNAVKYGSIVTVTVKKRGIVLTLKAKALQSGAIGEKIRLLNLTSKKTFFAKISNVNQATIR